MGLSVSLYGGRERRWTRDGERFGVSGGRRNGLKAQGWASVLRVYIASLPSGEGEAASFFLDEVEGQCRAFVCGVTLSRSMSGQTRST